MTSSQDPLPSLSSLSPSSAFPPSTTLSRRSTRKSAQVSKKCRRSRLRVCFKLGMINNKHHHLVQRITLITVPRSALLTILSPSTLFYLPLNCPLTNMFNSQTSEPFSSFPPPSSTSSASSSRIQSPQPSTRYNDPNGPLPLKNRTAHSAAPAYHPYRNNPPSHSSPPKPILFVDATFQPGDSASSTYSGAGLPQCRPKRKRITTEQLTRLLDVFEATDNPCFDVREQVGNVSRLNIA